MELMMEHLGKGIVVMLILSMPSVLVAASIGLVIGILQAVTQVQEQTIAAAPKILGVFLAIMILGGFSMNMLHDYFMQSSNIAFNLIPRSDEMVLPPSNYYVRAAQSYQDEYYGENQHDIKDTLRRAGKVPYSDTKYKESYTRSPKNVAYPPNFIESKKIYSGK
jgi:flagellar biosynthesis protein FliQ